MIERKMFNGYLNTDDSYFAVPQGEMINGENVRVQTDASGRAFAVKPVLGTTQRTGYRTDYVVIGDIYDKKTNRTIFFRHDPQGDHDIKIYDRTDLTVTDIIEDSQVEGGLGFTESGKINGVAIIDNFLYWTDGVNEPRRINIERAIKTNHGSYVSPDGTVPEAYTFPLRQSDISVSREQPINPPQTLKVDESRANNLIDGRAFQFAYRYEFKSGEVSTLSPYSLAVLHNNPDNSDTFDTIEVTIPSIEEIPAEVYAVQVLVRQGNAGTWAMIKSFDRDRDATAIADHVAGTAPLSFGFHNDTNGAVISDAEAYKPFDSVPLTSQALAVASNRLFLGNNKEGYDAITTNSLAAEVVTETAGAGLAGEYILVKSICGSNTESFVVVKITAGTGGINGFYLSGENPSGFASGNLPLITTLSFGNRLGDLTLTNPDILDLLSICVPPEVETGFVNTAYTGIDPSVVGLGGFSNTEGLRVFRSNSSFKIGIVFFDGVGRNAGVWTEDDLILSTGETAYQPTEWNTAITWSLGTGIQLEIPVWATKYAIVRTRNLTASFFLQHYADNVNYATKDVNGDYSYFQGTITGDTVAVAIPLDYFEKEGMGYTFTEGDILKLYKDNGEIFKLRITGLDGKYILTESVNIGDNTGETYKVEIYTPNFNSESELFYEIGSTYRVAEPGSANRAYATTGGVITGDVTVKFREYDGNTDFVEAMNPDDKYWTEWITDIGRPNLVIDRGGQETLGNSIRFSGTLVEGSRVNGLNSFEPLDFKPMPSELGTIQNLVWTSTTNEYGNVLLAIGKSETASIYIGRTQIFDEKVTSALASSTDVIGSVNILKGSYGTSHPESVVENGGLVFFMDVKSGTPVRYAQNGLYPIGEAKMKSYFRKVSKSIYENSNRFYLYGGFDEFNDTYVLKIPQSGLSDGTIVTLDDIEGEIIFDEAILGDLVSDVTRDFIETFPIKKLKLKIVVETTQLDNMTIQYGLSTLAFAAPLIEGETLEYIFYGTGESDTLSFQMTNSNGNPKQDITATIEAMTCTYYDQIGCEDKVAVWSEGDKRWLPFQTYVPEQFGRLGEDLVSYYEGNLFVHDSPVKSKFYDTNHKARLMFVVNSQPEFVKIMEAIAIESDVTPNFVHFRTELPNIQSTDLIEGEFKILEGNQYADIRRDKLSPNTPGEYSDKLIKGDPVRGTYALVMVEFEGATDFEIRFINVRYLQSSGHIV